MLIGTENGLFGLESSGRLIPLWAGGTVYKIIRNGLYHAILTDTGVYVSSDLLRWDSRNQGLPVKTIKVYQNGRKSFLPQVQEIKDLEVHPQNALIMVCAVKDRVFLTRNAGRTWENLGMPSYRTNGIKAVAAADLPAAGGALTGATELTVFLSHSVYGIHYITPDRKDAKWTELNEGLETLETTGNPDEVSDIAAVVPRILIQKTPRGYTESIPAIPENTSPYAGRQAAGLPLAIYAAQTFRQRVYQLDWNQKRFTRLWSDNQDLGAADSLNVGRGTIRFVQEGTIVELDHQIPAFARKRSDLLELIQTIPENLRIKPTCLLMIENLRNPYTDVVNLSELWLLDKPVKAVRAGFKARGAEGRVGLYLPVNHAMDSTSLKPYLNIIEERGLDMVVIDMKDDYGRLRFTPKNAAVTAKGRVFRPVDIDAFLKDMKRRGIYTVARIVVFKDPELAGKEGGKYAVWDSRTNKNWVGYWDKRQKKTAGDNKAADNPLVEILPADDSGYEIVRTYYDERWVDPYSEEVWEYTAALSQELVERGFDEIQFDYIRFPTDGQNLANARYRWQDAGMDMESAILSFLRHVRPRIKAPISIDIYGANGWYRTGARTGQEVELLAAYVDVICPMYYPSHFEQDFLAQAPAEDRPYRIYRLGTERTSRIAKERIIVRPWVQAFYLNVSYDKKYYNEDYVKKEVEGIEDAGSPGLTYWNNSGRYADIPKLER
ncbi:MAG: hypothetical protein LBP76_06565 [Treponema sp.]|jgi:hypothetical protein|nr:hypothetical protein [Treponema sp.]